MENKPVTREDLKATEERLVEVMRDMQTELLRGYSDWNEAVVTHMRKIEAEGPKQ